MHLRVFAQNPRGRVYHYRDSSGLEVDQIVQLRDGSWAAFETKLGMSAVDSAAQSLLKLSRIVDQTRSGRLASLNVIVPNGLAYTRDDGVNVVPLALLGP